MFSYKYIFFVHDDYNQQDNLLKDIIEIVMPFLKSAKI
jgi:hypothetical protein